MLERKLKAVGGMPKGDALAKNMQLLSDHFRRVVDQQGHEWEAKLTQCIRTWRNYEENKQTVMDWMSTAEKLLAERNLESKQTVEAHKSYFNQINDRPLRGMATAASELGQFLSPEELTNINKTTGQLKSKWNKIMAVAPIHLAKLEFRLEEDNLASLLKEMDREITAQHQLLNRKQEDSQSVLQRHIVGLFYFTFSHIK